MLNNHVIDPTFFYQCIEQFSFNYLCIHAKKEELDDYGLQKFSYSHSIISGSLQSRGSRVIQRKEGNIIEVRYDFYCKSLYRINKYDFIVYKHNLLMCTEVNDYDEYGVRSCSLKMVALSDYRDLEEYLKYIEGDILV